MAKKVVVKGPSSMKGQGGKTHKGIKGPSAMKAQGGGGKTHAKVKGPDAMAETKLGKGHAMPGKMAKQGHSKLEKVSLDKIGGQKAKTVKQPNSKNSV